MFVGDKTPMSSMFCQVCCVCMRQDTNVQHVLLGVLCLLETRHQYPVCSVRCVVFVGDKTPMSSMFCQVCCVCRRQDTNVQCVLSGPTTTVHYPVETAVCASGSRRGPYICVQCSTDRRGGPRHKYVVPVVLTLPVGINLVG